MRDSRGHDFHGESPCRLPYSIIQAEKCESLDNGTPHQERGEMNRVQSSNRFARIRSTISGAIRRICQ
jgi:hypothetical protein